MKIIFIIVLLIHGLIHLMGFVKSFGIIEINQLTQSISKPIGFLWLIASLLFIIVSILRLFNKDWWWIIATVAVIISQILIILSWQDAKYGTILNVFILVGIIIGYAVWNFNLQTSKEIDLLLSSRETPKEEIITEDMLGSLPRPVKRWINQIGMVGENKVHQVHLKQKGLMKLEPDQGKWSSAKAEQYVTTDKPGFIWKVNMKMASFFSVYGKDSYRNGEAEMLIKLAGLFPVVNVANNKKANQSTLQRYLIELPLYPSAVLSPYLKWEETGEQSAKVTMTYEGVKGSAIYHFDKQGDFEKVSAMRYKDVDENSELVECVGEAIEHTVIDGIKIPTKLNISWVLDEGIFTWYKIEIYDVKFN